jgi:hypothetical protein
MSLRQWLLSKGITNPHRYLADPVDLFWEHKVVGSNSLIPKEATLLASEDLSPETYTRKEDLKNILNIAIDKLPERSSDIIKLKYGIGCPPHTLKDLSIKFNISRERVRQCTMKALRDLKRYLEIAYTSEKDRQKSRSEGLYLLAAEKQNIVLGTGKCLISKDFNKSVCGNKLYWYSDSVTNIRDATCPSCIYKTATSLLFNWLDEWCNRKGVAVTHGSWLLSVSTYRFCLTERLLTTELWRSPCVYYNKDSFLASCLPGYHTQINPRSFRTEIITLKKVPTDQKLLGAEYKEYHVVSIAFSFRPLTGEVLTEVLLNRGLTGASYRMVHEDITKSTFTELLDNISAKDILDIGRIVKWGEASRFSIFYKN